MGDATYHADYFNSLVKECSHFLFLIPRLNDAQITLELLRSSFSLTKVMHVMRASPSGKIAEAAKELDAKVRKSFSNIFCLDIDDAMCKN